jgi:hypothetical protein
MSNFVALLNSVPQSCPTDEVVLGHVSAGQKIPFGIHTLWQGQDYYAFSTNRDEASLVSFSDVYNTLGFGGKILQDAGPNTWIMHLNDAAHYTIALNMANNIVIGVRLAPDVDPSQTVAPVTPSSASVDREKAPAQSAVNPPPLIPSAMPMREAPPASPVTSGHVTLTALSYRVVPHEYRSSYTTPGYSNSSCYGSGTYFGGMATANVSCSTVTTPPQTHTSSIQWVDVYDQLESDGIVYTVHCTAHWIGSNCAAFTPGDIFSGEIHNKTLWVTAHKGGNLGREVHAKYQLLDVRPKRGEPLSRP